MGITHSFIKSKGQVRLWFAPAEFPSLTALQIFLTGARRWERRGRRLTGGNRSRFPLPTPSCAALAPGVLGDAEVLCIKSEWHLHPSLTHWVFVRHNEIILVGIYKYLRG